MQSMRCSCASLLGPPKVESECAGGAETKHWITHQYWQVHCLLVLMYCAFRIHQPWLKLCFAGLQQPSFTRYFQSQGSTVRAELCHQLPLRHLVCTFLCFPCALFFMESEQQEGNALGQSQWAPSPCPQGPFSVGLLSQRLPGEAFLGGSDEPQHEGTQLLPKPSCSFTWCWSYFLLVSCL